MKFESFTLKFEVTMASRSNHGEEDGGHWRYLVIQSMSMAHELYSIAMLQEDTKRPYRKYRILKEW